ncbi:MAG: NUDIX hydrolase [Oscillospiraceae bacterium]|nr:NUDIX hydrolase [Oscillospiraceae bacterium]
MDIREAIAAYSPFNAQEAADKALILAFLRENPDAFCRTNRIAHMTASAWVVNPARDRVLMVYHKIYDSWSWTGGHADGEEDLAAVALREVREETGVRSARLLSEEIFSLESLTVDGHEKHGEYVSSHLHLNVTYLMEADDSDPLTVCEEENSGVRWFTLDGALEASTEPWFVQRIYRKLNDKLRAARLA